MRTGVDQAINHLRTGKRGSCVEWPLPTVMKDLIGIHPGSKHILNFLDIIRGYCYLKFKIRSRWSAVFFQKIFSINLCSEAYIAAATPSSRLAGLAELRWSVIWQAAYLTTTFGAENRRAQPISRQVGSARIFDNLVELMRNGSTKRATGSSGKRTPPP
jgi:hypothetical protein